MILVKKLLKLEINHVLTTNEHGY